MKLALLVLVAAVIAACDFSFGIEPRCLNDRVPYSAMPDTVTLVHCSTVDSLALHHDTTKAKP